VDAYGRYLGTCRDRDGHDLGRMMVASGMALAYRRYSTRYVTDEASAKKEHAGMWAGRFSAPWEWRQRH